VSVGDNLARWKALPTGATWRVFSERWGTVDSVHVDHRDAQRRADELNQEEALKQAHGEL
jgi:hypothetical protein